MRKVIRFITLLMITTVFASCSIFSDCGCPGTYVETESDEDMVLDDNSR